MLNLYQGNLINDVISIWGGETMIDNTNTNNTESSSKESVILANGGNAENSRLAECLYNANQETTDSLVERMISDQQDKVNPEVSITKEGALDLQEGQT